MPERLMIFIDGSNLFHTGRLYGKHYRIEDLCNELSADRQLVRTYYYGSIPTGGDDDKVEKQKGFHMRLEYGGINVSIIPLKTREVNFKCPKCGAKSAFSRNVEKGVDVALVTDMLAFGFRDGYDVALLVAGDLDYIRAIEEVKRIPKRVEIAFFESIQAISGALKRKADRFIPLEPIINKIGT
jgi:uncharacterized LabA/DUF88 family protein